MTPRRVHTCLSPANSQDRLAFSPAFPWSRIAEIAAPAGDRAAVDAQIVERSADDLRITITSAWFMNVGIVSVHCLSKREFRRATQESMACPCDDNACMERCLLPSDISRVVAAQTAFELSCHESSSHRESTLAPFSSCLDFLDTKTSCMMLKQDSSISAYCPISV